MSDQKIVNIPKDAELQMLSTFVGLSDRDAFAQLFNDVSMVLFSILQQRGLTTDEDLLEKTQWRLETALGYNPPSDNQPRPALKVAVEKFLDE